jgi:L-fucose mutarotase
MLKKISPIIGADLIKVLMEMGHTDEIVICDGNMPACTMGKRIVNMPGHNVPEILEAILDILPLDHTVEKPAAICRWDGPDAPIWDTYAKIIKESEEGDKFQNGFLMLPPAEFNAAVANAYCLITTSEKALAANIILRKGIM